MTTEERAQLRKLCEKATEGPWRVERQDVGGGKVRRVIDSPHGLLTHVSGSFRLPPESDANADVMAAARTALPDLLAALDAAEARGEQQERYKLNAHGRELDNLKRAEEAEARVRGLGEALKGLLDAWPEPIDAMLTRKEMAALDRARAALSPSRSEDPGSDRE